MTNKEVDGEFDARVDLVFLAALIHCVDRI